MSNATGYYDPLPPHAQIGRSDMGVDASMNPGDNIIAFGSSKLVGIQSNWYAGQPFMWFQLLDGPKAGKYWYVAEQIQPLSTRAGTVFPAGTPVAKYASSGTGIEIGWAAADGRTEAAATTGYTEGQATPAGTDFHNFITALRGGAPYTGGSGGTADASLLGGLGGAAGGSLFSTIFGFIFAPGLALVRTVGKLLIGTGLILWGGYLLVKDTAPVRAGTSAGKQLAIARVGEAVL